GGGTRSGARFAPRTASGRGRARRGRGRRPGRHGPRARPGGARVPNAPPPYHCAYRRNERLRRSVKRRIGMRALEKAYHERRAAENDDWWLGTGLFAERDRPGWQTEVEALIRAVDGLPAARVLDVACGTGFLTRHLRGEVTGLDQSEAMLEIAGARLPGARMVRADVPPLPFADHEFERVFTSHFYGLLEDP